MVTYLTYKDTWSDTMVRVLRIVGCLDKRNIASKPSLDSATMGQLGTAEHTHCLEEKRGEKWKADDVQTAAWNEDSLSTKSNKKIS